MSHSAALDIRTPIGALFAILGVLLAGFGLITPNAPAESSLVGSTNVDLYWGLFMLVFGLLMLAGARRGRRRAAASPALDSPEGRATEAREHRLGLEKER